MKFTPFTFQDRTLKTLYLAFFMTLTTIGVAFIGLQTAGASSEENTAHSQIKEFYINTVHIDGKTNIHGDATHKPEPFPNEQVPDGRGLQLTKPTANGQWKMRAFAFVPAQIIVHEGDKVRLKFVGVQGAKHTVHVEGEGVDRQFQITRGRIQTVEFTAGKAGTVEIECYDHKPNMNAQVLILPKR